MLVHTNMASEQKMLVCIRRGPASLPNINGRASCRWIFIYLTRSLQASYCIPSTPHIFPLPPWLLFLHRTPKRFPIYWWLRISFAGLQPSVLSEGSPVPRRPCSLPSQHFILLSDGNIPCGKSEPGAPCPGKSPLSLPVLQSPFTSGGSCHVPAPWFFYDNQLQFVHFPSAMLPHLSSGFPSAAACNMRWAVPQPLCVQGVNPACKTNSSCCFSLVFCAFQAISQDYFEFLFQPLMYLESLPG